ncbi:MAG: glycine--tRNA ligase [Candidatus Saccharimonadales bacterium]
MKDISLDELTSLCKRRGFIFQGSEVYGGLSGTWDYGPLGVLLKKNIQNIWWKMFVEQMDNMYGVDAAILMNQKVWQASGHVDTFTDPLVECSECKGRFREDKLENKEVCPSCRAKSSFSEPKQFNLMFKTNVGPLTNEDSISYLRPETAQGIFTNFKNVVDTFYPSLPFGIAQIGKAFRNEISPRDFVFRSREFEQMEIEYFINPKNWEQEFEKWVKLSEDFFKAIGLPSESIHKLEVEEEDRAHYSKRTIDFEFDYPHGRDEISGLAYRTDFDLGNIERVSKKKMEYTDKFTSEKFIPHVIEPSFGVERALMAALVSAYHEDGEGDNKRAYLKFSADVAPIKFVVSPLVRNKDEIVTKAREVYSGLKLKYGNVLYDDNSNVGKRYRRADEIGVPKCITIDFQTLEDGTVTVRDRDTMEQVRVKIEDIEL